MTQIKAAFFDIDGTLLPFHAKALPESTVQALAALRENGVKPLLPQAARRCTCRPCTRWTDITADGLAKALAHFGLI